MNTAQRAARYRVVAALAIFINLALLTALLWPKQPDSVIEHAAPAIIQADGSLIAARTETQPNAKPTHMVPKGAKVERIVSATIEPAGTGIKLPSGQIKCPPVTVDMTLDRMEDGTRRVGLSSPDGQITKAIDIPVDPAPAMESPRKWAAGLSYDPVRQTTGAWLERDLWRVRVGLDVNQTRQSIGGPIGSEARLRVGFTF